MASGLRQSTFQPLQPQARERPLAIVARHMVQHRHVLALASLLPALLSLGSIIPMLEVARPPPTLAGLPPTLLDAPQTRSTTRHAILVEAMRKAMEGIRQTNALLSSRRWASPPHGDRYQRRHQATVLVRRARRMVVAQKVALLRDTGTRPRGRGRRQAPHPHLQAVSPRAPGHPAVVAQIPHRASPHRIGLLSLPRRAGPTRRDGGSTRA